MLAWRKNGENSEKCADKLKLRKHKTKDWITDTSNQFQAGTNLISQSFCSRKGIRIINVLVKYR